MGRGKAQELVDLRASACKPADTLLTYGAIDDPVGHKGIVFNGGGNGY